MSLVAYGSSSSSSGSSSDENSDEDEAGSENKLDVEILVGKTRAVMTLPAPKDTAETLSDPRMNEAEKPVVKPPKDSTIIATNEPKLFKNLPKPKHLEINAADEPEDEVIIASNETTTTREKPMRKNRGPVKISLPSLSEFKDVEEEEAEKKRTRVKPSEKGTGLFAVLPPPRGSFSKATVKSLIPDVVKKVKQPLRPAESKPIKRPPRNDLDIKNKIPLTSVNYDSDSDEESVVDKENGEGKVIDFFSLASDEKSSPIVEIPEIDLSSVSEESKIDSAVSRTSYIVSETSVNENLRDTPRSDSGIDESEIGEKIEQEKHTVLIGERGDNGQGGGRGGEGAETGDSILTSNVMNLPKEEIRLKNKAEVGPKLPVPEQEYNVDSQGNVAFDEKAIEYLCGKRGVKRKNKDFDEANIIEINGEDIKPDEREWLVKALTEEPAERPGSQGPGPSTQSRKKHQITYLAHQAKAMEVELKNQWAQNRVTRKQTQSKYGF